MTAQPPRHLSPSVEATDPVSLAQALIRCRSVTPAEGGALDLLQSVLEPLGFTCHRLPFGAEDGRPMIDNLYARLGTGEPHLMFAGHTDVVPSGDEQSWSSAPFDGAVLDGRMIGRGAVDMKGGIAAFVAAVAGHLAQNGTPNGSVSLLITGDEEGPALDGTIRVLQWATEQGERWDGALVGEPTNPDALGDMIKIGRRGSHSAKLTVRGTQGHVAYPHLAANPIPALMHLIGALQPPLDEGTEAFQPSNLEVTSVDTDNAATNVIPGKAEAKFNIRFNDRWTGPSIVEEITARLDRALDEYRSQTDARPAISYDLQWAERISDVFVTKDERLPNLLSCAVEGVTGRKPALSTTGGTSDARFIKDYCPVVEFGLVGQTMHKIDEAVPLADLNALAAIYRRFFDDWFRTDRA